MHEKNLVFQRFDSYSNILADETNISINFAVEVNRNHHSFKQWAWQ